MLLRFPLSLAMIGLPDAPLRTRIERAASLGFRAVQLNAADAESRPRDLSRSARRDLAALLRRHSITFSGMDLFIPPDHYADPAHADRAAEAVSAAMTASLELASLASGRAIVCITLPEEQAAAGVVAAMADRARMSGVWLADASWPPAWTPAGIAICIDPAAILLAKEQSISPAKALASSGAAVVCARLADLSAEGRVEPGTGRLDLLSYLAAASACPSAGAPVLDLRGVSNPERIAANIVARCGEVRPG